MDSLNNRKTIGFKDRQGDLHETKDKAIASDQKELIQLEIDKLYERPYPNIMINAHSVREIVSRILPEYIKLENEKDSKCLDV